MSQFTKTLPFLVIQSLSQTLKQTNNLYKPLKKKQPQKTISLSKKKTTKTKNMNPSHEQKLREEVIYLHSLWHQGPPTQNPNPNPNPRPNNPSNNLHVTHTTLFKTKPDPQPVSGKEWPVNPTPLPTTTGWPELKPHSDPPTIPVSIQDQATLFALQVQHKALQSCIEFFTKSDDTDTDEESENGENDDVFEDGNEDYLMGNDGFNYEQSEEFVFLLKIFVEDNELRGFYEKSIESGEFCCLVCSGVGEKVGKRFKGCLGLVQHSISIAKTKRKRAHRAFCQVVCRVLGWDMNRLPMIVLKGEPLSWSLANSGHTQGEHKENTDGNKDDSVVVDSNAETVDAINGGTVAKDSESIVYESPLSECDGDKHVENLDNGVSSIKANEEEVTGCQGSDPALVCNIQWPCGWPTLNSQTASVTHTASSSIALGWSTLKPQKTTLTRPVSAEEQVRFAALQLQQKVVEACREFFVNATGSDSNEDDSEDEDEDDLMDEDGFEGCNEFKFFLRVFVENSELRSYYENNHADGEFCCLVCGGIGKKAWKRFKGCVGLLQHSTAISKTKKKQAHRAFGQVICKVLGWDIDRLPTIVSKGETLSLSLSTLSQGELKGSAEGNEDDSVVVKNRVGSMDGNNGELIEKGASDVTMNNGELMVCENALKGDVVDNHVKNLDSGVPCMEADKEGAVDHQVSLKKDDSAIEADNIQGRTVGIDGLKEYGTQQS